MELRQFQWMSSHFISGHYGSVITTIQNIWWRCTQLFSDLWEIEVVKCRKELSSKATTSWMHLGCSFFLQLVVVFGNYVMTVSDFCFIYKTAWYMSHNFHCGWRVVSIWRIKCTHSLVSAQTCLVYKFKQVLFLLSYGHVRFIQAHATLTRCQGLLHSVYTIFMGCVSPVSLHQFQTGISQPFSLAEVYCCTQCSYDVTLWTIISENDPGALSTSTVGQRVHIIYI